MIQILKNILQILFVIAFIVFSLLFVAIFTSLLFAEDSIINKIGIFIFLIIGGIILTALCEALVNGLYNIKWKK